MRQVYSWNFAIAPCFCDEQMASQWFSIYMVVRAIGKSWSGEKVATASGHFCLSVNVHLG